MNTKAQIEAMEAVIDREFAHMEGHLVERICRSIYHGKGSSDINAWRMSKLKQLRGVSRELKSYIASESYKREAKVTEALEKALKESSAADAAIFEEAAKAGIIPKAKIRLVSEEGSVARRYKDMILTNARQQLNLVNTRALQVSEKAFKDTVNSAWLKARAGYRSIDDCVQEACHKLGGSGLHVDYISDKGKRTRYPLDASIRRDLVTSYTQSTAEMTLAQNMALDNDLVQVSTIADSRPEHAPYQGNVYSYGGRSRKYPSLSVTGFGTAGGLCGCNCRHQIFPYFEEIEGTHRNESLSKTEKESNEKAYGDSQLQRKLERDIRHWKRQVMADEAGAPGMAAFSKKKLDEAENSMRRFIDESGRKRRFAREKV